MDIIIEIRAAEGGRDSELLVEWLRDVYVRACERRHL